MHRIPVVLIVMLWSVGLYLSLRGLKQYNISLWMQSLVMFLPTSIIFGVIAYMHWLSLWIGWEMLGYMIPVAIVFSWFSNRMSLLSMQRAPNPGYSLVLSKSFVILTSILAVPLFHAALSWIDICSIIIIIWFSSLILIDPKNIPHKQSSWNRIMPALYCFLGWAWLALSSNRFLHQELHPFIINFWIFLIVSCMLGGEGIIKKHSLTLPRSSWLMAGAVVASAVVYNRAIQRWYQLAPNPGFVNAANTSSIALLSILSAWIFHDALSLRKMIGIIGVVIGIILLFIF